MFKHISFWRPFSDHLLVFLGNILPLLLLNKTVLKDGRRSGIQNLIREPAYVLIRSTLSPEEYYGQGKAFIQMSPISLQSFPIPVVGVLNTFSTIPNFWG